MRNSQCVITYDGVVYVAVQTFSTTGVLLCHNTFTLIVTLHSDTSDWHTLNHWTPPLSQHIHSHHYTTQRHIRLTRTQPLESSSVTTHSLSSLHYTATHQTDTLSTTGLLLCHQARMQRGGLRGLYPPPNLSEVKFSGSTFDSCTTVTAQFSSFVHQCGCSQL